jgi:hypothetical protein
MEEDIKACQLNADEIATYITKLDEIEHSTSVMKISLDFTDRIYTLRQHVDYVRVQLGKKIHGLTMGQACRAHKLMPPST